MDIPGIDALSQDTEAVDRANEKAEELLDLLKEKVQTEVKDVGTLRKELRVTVPGEVIAERLAHDFSELRSDAQIRGFRKGHAPLELVQRRFAPDVRKTLKTSIMGQSFFAAMEKLELEPLGDPLFKITGEDGEKLVEFDEATAHMELPVEGDFTYTCEVELKPTVELPELEGIEVVERSVEITDEMVDDEIMRQRKVRGRYEPVEGGEAGPDDIVIADARLIVDGKTITEEDNIQLGVRPTRLDGISLMTLEEDLAGAKASQTIKVTCTIPDDYSRPELRGKEGTFEFAVHEIKRLEPMELDAFVEQMGYDSADELRADVRSRMEAEVARLRRRENEEQVQEYLLEHSELEIPEGLSARQTDRAVVRRVIELQREGVPDDEIEAKIDELRTTAREQVTRDLKIGFIMEKVAEKLDVSVSNEELNSEIALMARLYNRRFDRMRDDLAARGMLAQLAERIRESKCMERILAKAKVTSEKDKKASSGSEKTADKKTKRTGKKTEAKSAEKKGKDDDAGS